ncbi:MAG: hypothetical protein KGO50_04545 [Myxococcales bacterium]|nr:hypothetical protein [Myxococcales bacterium]
MRLAPFFRVVVLSLALLAAPGTVAFAQDVAVELTSDGGTTGYARLENRFAFPVKVANVQVTFVEPDGSEVSFDNAEPLDINLQPGASTDIAVSFPDAGERQISDAERVLAGVGVDIDLVAGPAQAALDGGDDARIREALTELRRFIPPVSRAARLQATALARNEEIRRNYFDLERLDGLRAAMEAKLCESASTQILNTRGAARISVYEEVGPLLREVSLHVNCISNEAKLAMAQTLVDSARPQDALLFREEDEQGNLLPEWRPIILEASVAFATTAKDIGASSMQTLGPAITALGDAREIAPEDPRVVALADELIPRLCRWVVTAMQPATEDRAGALEAITLLHPAWGTYPDVAVAGEAVASQIVEDGLALCRNDELVAARNEFVRGERILDGIPAWENNAEEINRCRALATLDEGIEMASNPNDPRMITRGYRKLEEAQSRYDLTQEEIDGFKSAMVDAWIARATQELEANHLDTARAALDAATEIAPGGTTEALREAWVRYVEKLTLVRGMGMNADDMEEGEAALSRAEGVDPARIDAARSGMQRAYYTLRFGIPAAGFLLGLIAILYAILQKQKAKRLSSMADLD